MTKEQQKILETIADSLAVAIADIDMESSLQNDLGLNPVETADLFQSVATKFNIVFDPHETEGVRTISDLVLLVEDKLIE